MGIGTRWSSGRAAGCVAALALAACATPPPASMRSQPALAQLAQPYVAQLRAARVIDVEANGSGVLVRAATAAGAVYTRYPDGVASLRFTLFLGPDGVSAGADSFDAVQVPQYAQALQAILPQVIRAAESNNRMAYERANPDH